MELLTDAKITPTKMRSMMKEEGGLRYKKVHNYNLDVNKGHYKYVRHLFGKVFLQQLQ